MKKRIFYIKKLDLIILEFFQQVLHNINLYFDSFKFCKQKLEEKENTNFTKRTYIFNFKKRNF